MQAFDYACVRVVPRVERGESLNAGLLLCCPRADVLLARVLPVAERVRMLDPCADLDGIQCHLEAWVRVAAGDVHAGPVANLELRERFHWLVHPKSAILQVGEVHSGLCSDPAQAFEALWSRIFG